MTTLQRKPITVKSSGIHGFGVFSEVDIFPGDLIEQCYFLYTLHKQNGLNNFTFKTDSYADNDKTVNLAALPLGNGVIYNHSDEPNADYFMNEATQMMSIKAIRPIQRGEEIFIHYGGDWFKDREIVPVMIKPAPLRLAYRVKWFIYKYKGYLRMLFGSAVILGVIQLLSSLSFGFVVGY